MIEVMVIFPRKDMPSYSVVITPPGGKKETISCQDINFSAPIGWLECKVVDGEAKCTVSVRYDLIRVYE